MAETNMIELDDVGVNYALRGGQHCAALRGVSLRIAAGEHVAILGKSGTGKSTLLNLIAALDRPTSGRLRVAGKELATVRGSTLDRWRGRTVGIVFQFFQLLPTLTVLENLLLAMEFANCVPAAGRRARALELLAQVELEQQAHRLPSMLSGGQQQRAAIARALANDPPIVVADEPTGNLDSETGAKVGAVFARLAATGKTLVIVTHDAGIAGSAGRVIELRDGTVIADRRRAMVAA
jgi:putative ABC transport system ATP-binding protein